MKNVVFFGIWGHQDAAKTWLISDYTVFNTVVKKGPRSLEDDAGQLKQYVIFFSQKVFRNPTNLDKLTGTGAIGHVRYATAGEASGG